MADVQDGNVVRLTSSDNKTGLHYVTGEGEEEYMRLSTLPKAFADTKTSVKWPESKDDTIKIIINQPSRPRYELNHSEDFSPVIILRNQRSVAIRSRPAVSNLQPIAIRGYSPQEDEPQSADHTGSSVSKRTREGSQETTDKAGKHKRLRR